MNEQLLPTEPNPDSETRAIRRFDGIPPFKPSWWCCGGWLQTASVKVFRPTLSLETRSDHQCISVPDGHSPTDQLIGYFFPKTSTQLDRPLVIVFHGMGGSALAGYMRSICQRLNDEGHDVILWNNRGSGRSAKTCSRLHHPGRTDDIRLLLNFLTDQRPEWSQNGLAGVAYSLGANLLLKYLAESGIESKLDVAVSISAPLDMEITSRNLGKGMNRAFDRYLLRYQKEELLRDTAELSSDQRDVIAQVKSVWELDNQFTASLLGYDSAEAFYAANSAVHTIEQIRTPTLLLHAEDDPVVDRHVFNGINWDDNHCLHPAMVASGGHTGFLDRNGNRWHEEATVAFLYAIEKR